MPPRTVVAVLAFVTLAGCVDPVLDPDRTAKKGGVTGAFYCESLTHLEGGEATSSGPCDTQEPLILLQNGQVYWAGTPYGTYRVDGARISFTDESHMGPGGWGRGQLSEDAITFTAPDRITVWRLGDVPSDALPY